MYPFQTFPIFLTVLFWLLKYVLCTVTFSLSNKSLVVTTLWSWNIMYLKVQNSHSNCADVLCFFQSLLNPLLTLCYRRYIATGRLQSAQNQTSWFRWDRNRKMYAAFNAFYCIKACKDDNSGLNNSCCFKNRRNTYMLFNEKKNNYKVKWGV